MHSAEKCEKENIVLQTYEIINLIIFVFIFIYSFHSLFPATKPMVPKWNSTFTNFPNITFSGNILQRISAVIISVKSQG
jgi:hypothetical protein